MKRYCPMEALKHKWFKKYGVSNENFMKSSVLKKLSFNYCHMKDNYKKEYRVDKKLKFHKSNSEVNLKISKLREEIL